MLFNLVTSVNPWALHETVRLFFKIYSVKQYLSYFDYYNGFFCFTVVERYQNIYNLS